MPRVYVSDASAQFGPPTPLSASVISHGSAPRFFRGAGLCARVHPEVGALFQLQNRTKEIAIILDPFQYLIGYEDQ